MTIDKEFDVKNALFKYKESELVKMVANIGNQPLMDLFLEWMDLRNWLNKYAIAAMLVKAKEEEQKKQKK